MERTIKIKITLGVTLFFLAVRVAIGFFPVPLEFEPYTGERGKSNLQEAYIVEISHYMSLITDTGDALHYYEIKTKDGKTGMLSSAYLWENKTYAEPVHITGMQNVMVQIDRLDDSYVNTFFEGVQVSEPFLSAHEGDERKAYAAVEKMTVLNRDYTETEENHPAAFWVAVCAFASFCVMVAMLLKEYAGGRRKKVTDETEG